MRREKRRDSRAPPLKDSTFAAQWSRATQIMPGYATDSAELDCQQQVCAPALVAFRAT